MKKKSTLAYFLKRVLTYYQIKKGTKAVSVTVHTAGGNKEHGDEDVNSNYSL